VPFDVPRRCPTYGEPETFGATTSTGACPWLASLEATSSVASDRAAPLPNAFEALTTTRTRAPRSRCFRRSVRPVPPRTLVQSPPEEAQSYHW
jgi:hypothetical protein